MNERKIFLQQALVLVRLHLLYFVYRPSEVQITRQNIQELSSNNFLKKTLPPALNGLQKGKSTPNT